MFIACNVAIIYFKKIIEESREKLDALPGVTSVHSRFYELCSNYHQLLCNHNEYYKDALRYLGCVEIETIPGNFLCFRGTCRTSQKQNSE